MILMALLSWTDVKVISGFQLILQSLAYFFNWIRKLVGFEPSYFQTYKNKVNIKKFVFTYIKSFLSIHLQRWVSKTARRSHRISNIGYILMFHQNFLKFFIKIIFIPLRFLLALKWYPLIKSKTSSINFISRTMVSPRTLLR